MGDPTYTDHGKDDKGYGTWYNKKDDNFSYSTEDHYNTYYSWVKQEAMDIWGSDWKNHVSDEQIAETIQELDKGNIEGMDSITSYLKGLTNYDDTEEFFDEQEQFLEHEYEMMMEYSPKMAEMMFNQYKEYAPQIAGIQQGIADDLYPEIKTLRDQVGERLEEGPTKLDEATKNFYVRSVREAQSDRGFLDSPSAGRAEGEGITKLARQQYDKDAALALSLPKVGVPGYNASNDYYSALGGNALGQQSTMFNQGIAQQNSDIQYQTFLEGLKNGAGTSGNQSAGAVGGAVAGAQMGTSIMPGWGTAIGAVVGGIAGYYSSDVYA